MLYIVLQGVYIMVVEFKEEDFRLFTNMINNEKRYFFADKIFDKYEIEVYAGKHKVRFDVDILQKESGRTIARGRYSSLKELNEGVRIFLLKNESFLNAL